MPKNNQNQSLPNILLIVFSMIWIVFPTLRSSSTAEIRNVQPQKGFLAPDFQLKSLDGNTVSLDQLNGKPILINFWASWCIPCQTEMPAIQEMFERYGSKIYIAAINNTAQDSLANVRAFVNKNQLTFPVLLDERGLITSSYQVQALPTTFFVNSNGVIQEIIIGGPMSETLLEIRFKQLLGEP